MTVAEIHGKISRSGSNLHDRLEDLLTSDVFGPVRYLLQGTEILNLLTDAQCADGSGRTLGEHEMVQALLKAGDNQPEFRFWPRLRRSEPDVLVTWTLPDGRRLILLLEAKYLSGKSGEGWTETEDGAPALSDQLGREYLDLRELAGECDRIALVYLTAHVLRPTQEIRETLAVLRFTGAPDLPDTAKRDIYWLNWPPVYRAAARQLQSTRETGFKVLWEDMLRLLERKGMASLRAWSNVVPGRVEGIPLLWRYLKSVEPNTFSWPAGSLRSLAWLYSSTGRRRYDWWLLPWFDANIPKYGG